MFTVEMSLRRVLLILAMHVTVLFGGVCSFENDEKDFLLVTVATNQTDGFKRFMRSAKVYNVPVKVLGMGERWQGGDIKRYAAGGFKVNLLKKELENHKDDKDKIIMFTDSYDVVILAEVKSILDQFDRFSARVLFSAEGFCWPDGSLASKYPTVQRGKRYLNSGALVDTILEGMAGVTAHSEHILVEGDTARESVRRLRSVLCRLNESGIQVTENKRFIGYAPELYEIVTSSALEDTDDDQLFYTNIYLNDELRNKYKIKLDHKAEIFQSLNGAVDDVELRFKGREAYLQNTVYNTVPLVVHGNGVSKTAFNTLANYLAKSWNAEDGCLSCWDDSLVLEDKPPETWPVVFMAVFVEQPTPFLEEFLDKLARLDYPKDRLHLFFHNAVDFHSTLVEQFWSDNRKKYRSLKTVTPSDDIAEHEARNLAIEQCLAKKCDYFFTVDSEAHLDNPHTLRLLVEQNRSIVAPLLMRPYKAWSNFWGALSPDGFYARSLDYMDIIHNERRGVWNVPYISGCYLVNGSIIANTDTRPSYTLSDLDPDMAFCAIMREKDVFMYVSNRMDFGHLVNSDNYDITKTNSEIYQVFDNRWDWEQRYIHENYTENFNPNKTAQQPCPDVYWFPIVTSRFCKEFIEIMEDYGQWSDGTNKDPRLDGGYENVPTRDIHMKQVGLEPHWMEMLRLYVRPLQELVFTGYVHDPPRALMNFVVRYRPDEQPFLRPHHDSSTYTINIALNRHNIDYQGGGCRFIRYNCSVTDTRMGWVLMHPGRLTHYHEGLLVTNGTRYIMISFVDP
ncbi:procollagen-lysine,2-oxoglutarate 5-dioxygenase isoform X3 [Bacillus rossius redtenbacheri]|uniref:procollagen-lysine,2-oxoglutarate 5-dioxygenase isoform X3 n=1 Tax=Bacillus rossius redtenbacheri TaxID=93214 RepID=UPI002FDC827B